MARVATTADAFKAVAEPGRRQILDVLAGGSGRWTTWSACSAWLSRGCQSTRGCSELNFVEPIAVALR